MQIKEFRRLINTFSDPGGDFQFEQNRLVTQIDGNLLEIEVKLIDAEVYVTDGEADMPANIWILKRLAKIDILCDRILALIPEPKPFVIPNCDYTASLEASKGGDELLSSEGEKAIDMLVASRSPFETTVIYLTSDAGEGKTTLLEHYCIQQARLFKSRETQSLVVPISLGGRPFLGFDDLIVGTLSNRYRFGHLYYQSFIELVKVGAIIPAFDGFEEMFVIKGSGEAVSALGMLLKDLESQGTIIVSARRAYFEYQDIKSQSRMLSTLKDEAVGFARVFLKRWTKEKFIEYLVGSGFRDSEAEEIYVVLYERVGENNPLVTRPVFVEKIGLLAEDAENFGDFIRSLNREARDPLESLLKGIIEREAHSKWLYRTRDASEPILTVDQHFNLLSLLALEMWDSSVTALGFDIIEMIAELFADREMLLSSVSSQVKERLKGHALLVSNDGRMQVEFDHDEFRWYFLGLGIANLLKEGAYTSGSNIRNAMRRGILPAESIHKIARVVSEWKREEMTFGLDLLQKMANEEGKASYVHENSAQCILAILNGCQDFTFTVTGIVFSNNSLQDVQLDEVTFESCIFSPTRIGAAKMSNCLFSNCQFVSLEFDGSHEFKGVFMRDCKIEATLDTKEHLSGYEENRVLYILWRNSIITEQDEVEREFVAPSDPDLGCVCISSIVRYFRRSNHIGEGVINLRLGNKSTIFFSEILPILLNNGILAEMPHRGSGTQRRFVLGLSLESINEALNRAEGNFDKFLAACAR